MSLDPTLKSALRQLRTIQSRRPADPVDSSRFAAWREEIAEVLELLAEVLPHEEDRVRASGEAASARAQVARLRRAGDCPAATADPLEPSPDLTTE